MVRWPFYRRIQSLLDTGMTVAEALAAGTPAIVTRGVLGWIGTTRRGLVD